MKIEHVEERKKLAALYAQRDAIIDEEQSALAPLQARLVEARDRAEREFIAVGGLTFEALCHEGQRREGSETDAFAEGA